MNLVNWLEQRTGLVSATQDFLTEDVPGGASYWYVFGSVTLFALTLQIVTGIFLTFYYAPSSATAWESTKYIYDHVPLGWFVMSLHYWGATAMIALLFMHMLQVMIWGAYKAPRELLWVVGVILLVVTLVLGLTGYLLPWDMNAYFASQVAINIASSVPIVGQATQQFLSGGPAMGTLTINRFFGLHVWLMPAILVLLAAGHLTIFRHVTPAGPPIDIDQKKLPQGRFWPNQVFMDAVASFVIFIVMVVLSIMSPPGLDAKADPLQRFTPYPAWYFLALYGLLRIAGNLPQNIVPIANLFATVIIPGGLVTVLILLPWLDRNPSRQLRRRPWLLGITAISIVVAVWLSIYSQMAIVKEQQEMAQGSPAAAAAAPASQGGSMQAGAPAGGTQAVGGSQKGAQVFAANCASCHGAQGGGTPGAFPPLAGNSDLNGDPAKIEHIVLYGLSSPLTVKGTTYNGTMPPWKGTLSNADISAVLTFVRGSWGNHGTPVSAADVAKVAK